jgi:hypothetical protein
MNESATFAERAEEIASRLNLINAAVGETVGLLTALHRDYTSAGRPWAAFCAEHFPQWGRWIDMLPIAAAEKLARWAELLAALQHPEDAKPGAIRSPVAGSPPALAGAQQAGCENIR